jgi:hypothetical protein
VLHQHRQLHSSTKEINSDYATAQILILSASLLIQISIFARVDSRGYENIAAHCSLANGRCVLSPGSIFLFICEYFQLSVIETTFFLQLAFISPFKNSVKITKGRKCLIVSKYIN